nr:hypothetical protein B0A51_08740 [Rachicladosporium sp. CCFEE 5018]
MKETRRDAIKTKKFPRLPISSSGARGSEKGISEFLTSFSDELRLIIYSYLDEVTTFTLKHVVVQDKVFLFRLKDVTDTLIIQSICRTIRDESLSLLHPAARYALTIDDNAYKATKVKGERKRQTAYEQLDLLSNSTHFAQVRELVVNIRSSGRSGKVMSDWLVTAVHEVMRRIEKAEKLERLKIIIPFGTRGTVLLNQSAHIASAREITVLIESVAVGSTASSENARLLDAVFATFRAIARNSKVEILIVKIKEGKPAFCNTACEIIAARRYPGKIQIDVEARGLSRGMLKMLEDFQREHEISMIA